MNLIYWQDKVNLEKISTNDGNKAPSIIQRHYSMNKCFIGTEPILENRDNIRHIPTKTIHGRYDMECPFEQTWQLNKRCPEAELSIIEMAGHVVSEPKIIDALIKVTNDFENVS